jgi:hypothetical protein
VKKPNITIIKGGANTRTVPTKEEVAMMAREAVLPSLRQMVQPLSDRIAQLYVEGVKTAVILNSLAEILIEKGVISKEELQARVTKNQGITEENYRNAVQKREQASKAPAQTVCENTPREDGSHEDTIQREDGKGTDGVPVEG